VAELLKSWLSPTAFGNQTISSQHAFTPGKRLTALRPCLATGLPLSCAIVVLQKAVLHGRSETTAADSWIKHYLGLFVNTCFYCACFFRLDGRVLLRASSGSGGVTIENLAELAFYP
jgi:hypothetical protein